MPAVLAGALPAQFADAVRASCTAGLASVFLLAVPLAVLACGALLFVRETPLEARTDTVRPPKTGR